MNPLRIAAAATLALAPLSVPVLAAPVGDPVRIRVVYADLDLAAPAGAARLVRRIRSAAQTACGGGSGGLRAAVAERRCRADLERRAQERVALLRLPTQATRIASAR